MVVRCESTSECVDVLTGVVEFLHEVWDVLTAISKYDARIGQRRVFHRSGR